MVLPDGQASPLPHSPHSPCAVRSQSAQQNTAGVLPEMFRCALQEGIDGRLGRISCIDYRFFAVRISRYAQAAMGRAHVYLTCAQSLRPRYCDHFERADLVKIRTERPENPGMDFLQGYYRPGKIGRKIRHYAHDGVRPGKRGAKDRHRGGRSRGG